MKFGDHGHNHAILFHGDGTLRETLHPDLDNEDTWPGRWNIVYGVLFIEIGPYVSLVWKRADCSGFDGIEFTGELWDLKYNTHHHYVYE